MLSRSREEVAALQALSVAQELATENSPLQLVARTLDLPGGTDSAGPWRDALLRFAAVVRPMHQENALLAAAYLATLDPWLSMADTAALAERIEAWLRECREEALAARASGRLSRVANLRPATAAEAESLIPIAGAVARAELEEVPPQPFQDAVAEAGGYAPKEIV